MIIKLPDPAFSLITIAEKAAAFIDRWLAPLFLLALRLYVAQVFFRSGWLKASSWDSTVELFSYVYHVPLLPPLAAAALGMTGELVLSALFAAGFASRFAAAGLFVVNLIAAISFPDISDLGLQDHVLWGLMILVPLFFGAGKIALDARFKVERADS